jgi:tetratricopeptide (TPR) repeat protein
MKKHVLAMAGMMMSVWLTGCSSTQESALTPPPEAPDNWGTEPTKIEPKTHIAAGRLQEAQGKHAEAAKNYREALRVDPNNREALYRLAISLTMSNQLDQSLTAWQRYVTLTNGSAEAYSNLAYTYQLAGQFKDAELNYHRALKADPKNQSAGVNYGLMLVQRDRIDEAEDVLAKFLKPAHVQYNIASVYELRGMNELARQRYERALALNPSFREAQQRMRLMETRTANVGQ